jgi:hypothetical protein
VSAPENQAPAGGWKKWLFVGAASGAGVAVVVAIIVACVVWYSSRPKQWNNRDIKATFSTPLFNYKDGDTSISGVDLEYVIENTTSNDFTLTPQQTFFLQDGGALRKSFTGNYKVDDQCFVPAKNKVKCEISVPAEFDTTYAIDGFALFDDATHYSIIFPKPTGPTPEGREKFIRDILKKQDNSKPVK